LQDPPKCTQIGIFGLKIYHLATLPSIRSEDAGLFSIGNFIATIGWPHDRKSVEEVVEAEALTPLKFIGRHFRFPLVLKLMYHRTYPHQGCQMAYFQTKNPYLGKFWRDLQWKFLVYFMAIWSI
jgi:hypothetical protein